MPRRSNGGFLAKPEGQVLDALVTRVPAGIGPDALTAIGILGAMLASLGFAMSLTTSASLFLVVLGLGLNWLGDSLDGRIARHRRIERRIEGFILDNGVDLVSYLLLAIGFALSDLVSFAIPFILLALYTLLSNLSLARMLVTGVHDLAIDGVGTSELRVGFLGLAVILFLFPDMFRSMLPLLEISVLDGLSLLWAAIMLVNFTLVLRRDIRLAHQADQRNAAQMEMEGLRD